METIKLIIGALIKFVLVLVLFAVTSLLAATLMIDFLHSVGLNVNNIDLMFFIIGLAIAIDAIRNYIYYGKAE